MTGTILVLENDRDTNAALCKMLQRHGCRTRSAYTGEAAVQMLREILYDAVLYEPILAENGEDRIFQKIRSFCQIPVLMIFTRNHAHMPIYELRFGADDFAARPLDGRSFDEQRILALLEDMSHRHSFYYQKPRQILTFSDISMDVLARRVLVNGYEISLTDTELRLLHAFLSCPQKLFTADNLSESVWNGERKKNNYSVTVPVRHLRNKLKQANPKKPYILTLAGKGYRMEE